MKMYRSLQRKTELKVMNFQPDVEEPQLIMADSVSNSVDDRLHLLASIRRLYH